MIQAILYGARDLRLEEKTLDPAAIGEGEVYVETDITALSTGTDLGNTWESFRYSVDLVRYGGRISVLGFPGRAQPAPDFNPLDPAWFYGKQLTLIGAGLSSRVECQPWDIRFNLRRNLEFILSAMAAGTINLEPIISHRFPARNMRDAYELASTHAKELMAAVFDWKAI